MKQVDPAQEREAIQFLKSRKLRVSADQLEVSAMEGKVDEVKALLAAGVPVAGTPGDSPLLSAMVACSENGETTELVEVVDVLIAAGADAKTPGDNNNTPLLTAAQYCGDKIVTLLIKAGADVKVANGTGITPLVMSLLSSRFEAADALIAAGSTMNERDVTMVSAMPDPRIKEFVAKATPTKKPAAKKKK